MNLKAKKLSATCVETHTYMARRIFRGGSKQLPTWAWAAAAVAVVVALVAAAHFWWAPGSFAGRASVSAAPPATILVVPVAPGGGAAGSPQVAPGAVPVFPLVDPIYRAPSPDQSFQQVGLLTGTPNVAADTQPTLLPLFGRRVRSDRFQYYVGSDKQTMLRLPVEVGGRKCDDDIGCTELYDGDKVVVPTYAGYTFVVTLYKQQPF